MKSKFPRGSSLAVGILFSFLFFLSLSSSASARWGKVLSDSELDRVYARGLEINVSFRSKFLNFTSKTTTNANANNVSGFDLLVRIPGIEFLVSGLNDGALASATGTNIQTNSNTNTSNTNTNNSNSSTNSNTNTNNSNSGTNSSNTNASASNNNAGPSGNSGFNVTFNENNDTGPVLGIQVANNDDGAAAVNNPVKVDSFLSITAFLNGFGARPTGGGNFRVLQRVIRESLGAGLP